MNNLATHSKRVGPGILQGALEIRYTARVIDWLHMKMQIGELRVGDRMPSQRELSRHLQTGLEGTRVAIDYLATIGVVKIRRKTGALIELGLEDLTKLLSALNENSQPLDVGYLFEARAVIEGSIAAQAARRHDGYFLSRLAEELMELYATVNSPREYLVHEVAFHRTLAQAAGNPALSILMVKIAAAFYDAFKDTVDQLVDRRESANRHRKIYRAIRDGKPEDASKATLDDIRREYAVYKAQFSSANSCVEER